MVITGIWSIPLIKPLIIFQLKLYFNYELFNCSIFIYKNSGDNSISTKDILPWPNNKNTDINSQNLKNYLGFSEQITFVFDMIMYIINFFLVFKDNFSEGKNCYCRKINLWIKTNLNLLKDSH